MRRPLLTALPLFALAALAGCEALQPPGPVPAAPTPPAVVELYARPAERALINGIRAYDDGVFDRAESSLRSALLHGLRNRRDLAAAHKYLAFITCAFNRLAECEQQFRYAFAADPDFLLTDAEIGHPVWGPVYRRVAASRKPAAARADGAARVQTSR